MPEVEKSTAQKNAMHELITALAATAITLVGAIIIYLWVPDMQYKMRAHAEQPGYTRVYSLENGTGRISYEVTMSDRETAEKMLHDVELLKRRFERGDFQLATVSLLSQKESVEAMTKQSNNFSYSIEKSSKGATLIINAKSAGARTALDNYLQFMKSSWKV